MKVERAIEILNPEHREHYVRLDSVRGAEAHGGFSQLRCSP